MSSGDPTYEELQARLIHAETLLAGLRRGEVDAVISESSVLLLSLQEAAAALREGEARYRSLFGHTIDAVLLIAADGRILTANPGACRLFGYAAAELAQIREQALIDQTDPKTLGAFAALASAGRFQGEIRYLRKDGSTLFIGETSAVIFGEQDGERKTNLIIRSISGRRRAEQRPRVGEERFRRYFELGLIGMATTSPTKGILEVNDELCRLLGYERRELLQKTWAEMTHPDDLAADVAQFNRVMAGEIDGYILDKRWVRKDGQIINSIMATQCMRRGDGSVDYFVGIVQDITDRRRAEDELRNANVRIEMILDSITDKFFAFDNRWHFTYFNKKAEEQLKTLGKNPASLIGKVPWEEFQTDPAVEEAFRRAMRERAVVTHEHYYPPLGEWVENRIYPSPDGGVAVFQRYITDRKRAGEELRRSEAFLAEGQKISHTGSWAVKFPSEEVLWSEEMYRIYGLDSAATKLSPEMAFELIHPDDRPYVKEAFDRAVRDKSDYALEHRAIMADGSVKHLHALGRPVLNESGELIEYIGTVMDVTEPKRREAAMQKLQTEVAHGARMAMMGELAASIAHEIDQPLGALVNNGNVAMGLVKAAETTTDRLLEVLSDIVSDADRASAIIARIRALAMKSIPERTSLQLKEVVADVLALAQRELKERSITVRTELAKDLPPVLGDRVQLQQVILNLVINASDVMSTVPELRRILTIRGEPSELNGQPAVLISVQDLGAGFTAEDGEQLFEAFYTTKPGGLGMGLRISRSIVEAHGGRLSAHVNEDVGATFRFCLPAETPAIIRDLSVAHREWIAGI